MTWPGAKIKKKGEGLPSNENYNLRGDLYITFDVKFPRGELTLEQKEGMYLFTVSQSGQVPYKIWSACTI